ncbi:MAG: thiamine-phosphate kinase, partial [Sphingomonadales bacterium]|jgi:thiamine-monophosphate kinase
LADDAACLSPPEGYDLVVTKDMLVADVHFRKEDDATDIAWKALAVNVSDLSAKGAKPWLYFLGLGLGAKTDEAWVRNFSQGLGQAQAAFGIALGGGDTISTGAQSLVSVTAFGLVPKGKMLKRSGARVGDAIYVSGTLGDAALGLMALQGELNAAPDALIEAYLRPQPRVALGSALQSIAHSCADVSDGLVADLGHICEASSCGAEIQLHKLPLSSEAAAVPMEEQERLRLAASHGDDYELVFTLPKEREAELPELTKQLGLRLTRIGEITAGNHVQVFDGDGQLVDLGAGGYRHSTES